MGMDIKVCSVCVVQWHEEKNLLDFIQYSIGILELVCLRLGEEKKKNIGWIGYNINVFAERMFHWC